MIKSFKHKGLKSLWEKEDKSKITPQQLTRVRVLLQIIDELKDVPKDLSHLISLRPHLLKGDLKGFWSGNWRIIFKFESGDAYEVNLIDTH